MRGPRKYTVCLAPIFKMLERLLEFIRPSDECPSLLIHTGAQDIARNDSEHNREDYKGSLGREIKGFGVQMVLVFMQHDGSTKKNKKW